MTVIIGNIIAFIGCILMVYVGLLKEKRRIIFTQCAQFALQAVANLILGGVSGFIANAVSILRNLAFAKWKVTIWMKLGFIALQILLSISTFDEGIIALLPLMTAIIFTWFLDKSGEIRLKIVIITCQLMWLVYDIFYLNYVSAVFDVFTVISNCAGIYLVMKDRKKK